MKYLVALALVLPLPALAANAGVLTSDGKVNLTCGTVPRPVPLPVPAKVIPAQTDLPAQLKGKGTAAVTDANAHGLAAGWWVARVDSVVVHLYAVTWWYLAMHPDLLARLIALAVVPGTDSSVVASLGAAYDPTLDIRDMCDVWSPLVAKLNATRPLPLDQQPPPPPPGTWKATGATIFKYANGRLTGPTIRKATKDAACDGVTVVTAGTLFYQGLVGGAVDEKTPCVKPP